MVASLVLRGTRIPDRPFSLEVAPDATRLSPGVDDLTALDLTPLAGHPTLEVLALGRQAFGRRLDIGPLASCPRLRELDLSGDITMASNEPTVLEITLPVLPALERLYLYANTLTQIDLGPLAASPRLEVLDLSWNHLTRIDLAPLAACAALRYLRLDHNLLEQVDLTPLAAHGRLSDEKPAGVHSLWLPPPLEGPERALDPRTRAFVTVPVEEVRSPLVRELLESRTAD